MQSQSKNQHKTLRDVIKFRDPQIYSILKKNNKITTQVLLIFRADWTSVKSVMSPDCRLEASLLRRLIR